jgi:hypothetical protein
MIGHREVSVLTQIKDVGSFLYRIKLSEPSLLRNWNRASDVASWPTAEIHSKPEKLSAAKLAEFASGRFAALCWARAIGQERSASDKKRSAFERPQLVFCRQSADLRQ